MKVSTCSYCGMTGFAENDLCFSCEKLFAADNGGRSETGEFPPPASGHEPPAQSFDSASSFAGAGHSAGPSSAASHQAAENYDEYDENFPTFQPVMDARCSRCGTLIERGELKCFDCQNKKFPFFKYAAVLLVLAGIGFFSFDYVLEKVSPWGIMRKSVKATGWDNSIIFENFVLKGEAEVKLSKFYASADDPLIEKPVLTISPIDAAGQLQGKPTDAETRSIKFAFRLVFIKPNKIGIELSENSSTAGKTFFKKVFDGEQGWMYVNMPNQPARYQDTGDAFSVKKMGLGDEGFSSVDFLDEAIRTEFGAKSVELLASRNGILMEGVDQSSAEKVIIRARKDSNGKPDSTLLVFDQKTGLLSGMLRKDELDGTVITTHIMFDNYKKFRIKYSGLLGVQRKDILVPTVWKFGIGDRSGDLARPTPYIVVKLNVEDFAADSAIEEGFFQKQ